MGNLLLFFKTVLYRLKHAFNFKDILLWKLETCKKCGSNLRIGYNVYDDIWNTYSGYLDGDGVLCLNCLLGKLEDNQTILQKEDLINLFFITKVLSSTVIEKR